MEQIDDLLEVQDGVIARRQVLDAGHPPSFVVRKVRRREWSQVHPGVYVNHTGPLTWRQRAWAAVLACWPAALDGWSAIRAHEGPGRRRDAGPVEIVVPHGRHPSAPPGVRVRGSRRFAESTQLQASPPRQRYDYAIVELADRAEDELSAVAILADACGGRRTTAERLHDRAARMTRLRRRSWMVAVLRDVATGACSVLEHRYLTAVERPHGLPRGRRQVAAVGPDGRRMFRDVVYAGATWRQIVELDGRLGHDTTHDRDRDFERDLDASLAASDTIRLGYGQVFERPCVTAAKVGRLLQQRGWSGAATKCPNCT